MKFPNKLIAIVALSAACTTTDKPATVDSTAAMTQPPAAPAAIDSPVATRPDTAAPAPAPEPGTPSPTSNWVVRPRGFGPVWARMTVAEAQNMSGNRLVLPANTQECGFARMKDGPEGVAFMIEQGKISRVDITKGSVATQAGAKIGDTEARIKSLYPNQVTVEPHKYTDGHYLVVTPKDPSDKDMRIVFETDGTKVLRYRAGVVPSVNYVESCL